MHEPSEQPPRRSRGQPTKLTAASADAICQRLRAGVPRVHAAESVGVARRTMMKWLEYGRAGSACEQPDCDDEHHGPGQGEVTYLHFLQQVEHAEAEAVVLAVGYVSKAMGRDWRAAFAWLERRHPSEFKPKDRVEFSGPHGGPVEIEVSSVERLKAKIDEVARRLREQMEESTDSDDQTRDSATR